MQCKKKVHIHWIISSADDILKYFCVFFPEDRILTFHANCLLKMAICMKCKILFSRKNKTNISLSSAGLVQSGKG